MVFVIQIGPGKASPGLVPGVLGPGGNAARADLGAEDRDQIHQTPLDAAAATWPADRRPGSGAPAPRRPWATVASARWPASRPEHRQQAHRVRLEWGPVGVELLAADCAAVIVVDVLSFCTSVDIAVGRGAEVLPQRWGDRAARPGRRGRPRRAPGRTRAPEPGPSLRPSSLLGLAAGTRLALPSPNGATLCAAAAGRAPWCSPAACATPPRWPPRRWRSAAGPYPPRTRWSARRRRPAGSRRQQRHRRAAQCGQAGCGLQRTAPRGERAGRSRAGRSRAGRPRAGLTGGGSIESGLTRGGVTGGGSIASGQARRRADRRRADRRRGEHGRADRAGAGRRALAGRQHPGGRRGLIGAGAIAAALPLGGPVTGGRARGRPVQRGPRARPRRRCWPP